MCAVLGFSNKLCRGARKAAQALSPSLCLLSLMKVLRLRSFVVWWQLRMGPGDGEDDVVGIGEYVQKFVKYKETKNYQFGASSKKPCS